MIAAPTADNTRNANPQVRQFVAALFRLFRVVAICRPFRICPPAPEKANDAEVALGASERVVLPGPGRASRRCVRRRPSVAPPAYQAAVAKPHDRGDESAAP